VCTWNLDQRSFEIQIFYQVSIVIINLLAQQHDRVTGTAKQSEQDSKDTAATNSCRRNVQVKTIS